MVPDFCTISQNNKTLTRVVIQVAVYRFSVQICTDFTYIQKPTCTDSPACRWPSAQISPVCRWPASFLHRSESFLWAFCADFWAFCADSVSFLHKKNFLFKKLIYMYCAVLKYLLPLSLMHKISIKLKIINLNWFF